MKRFIVGDIHARFDLLRDVLDKAGFNEDEDVLYSVGDLCNRGDKPVETLFFLMSLRDFRPVLGNHDAWLEEYLCTGIPDPSWTRKNGGDITCRAMRKLSRKSREMLRLWLRTFPILRIENDLIIVHGGFPSEYTEKELIELSKVSRPSPLSAIYSEAYEDENLDWMEEMIWDRDYLFSATPESRRMPYWMPRHEIKPIEQTRQYSQAIRLLFSTMAAGPSSQRPTTLFLSIQDRKRKRTAYPYGHRLREVLSEFS